MSTLITKKDLKILVYFMQCYFCQTFYWSELKNQADAFRLEESEAYCIQLKNALVMMRQNYTWEEIKHIVGKHAGVRIKGEENVKYLINTIIDSLS